MKKNKQNIRNILILMIGMLFLFVVVGVIYIANKAYALPSNITVEKGKEDTDSVIGFDTTTDKINFNVTIKNSTNKEYFNTITFMPTFILDSIKDKNITLKLEKSTDNSSFTEVETKTITNSLLNTNITYLDKVSQTDNKIYYKLSAYVDNVLQDIRNNNISGKLNIKTYKNYSFEQIDTSQEWIVDETGNYRIELWGAAGNYYPSNMKEEVGKGAYTAGTLHLEKGTKLYIYTGKNATDEGTFYSSSFNAGSTATGISNASHNMSSGGGATDIRFISGDWNNDLSLNSRIMVAGGGGGTQYAIDVSGNKIHGIGGAGGGLYSYSGSTYENGIIMNGYNIVNFKSLELDNTLTNLNSGVTYGYTGMSSQIAGGVSNLASLVNNTYNLPGPVSAIGKFGIGATNTESFPGSGGGGGYYGGAAGSQQLTTANTGLCHSSGAGGSSYISGYKGSIGITSETDRTAKCTEEEALTNEECSNHYSNYVFTDAVMIDGNGYDWSKIPDNLKNYDSYFAQNKQITQSIASNYNTTGLAKSTINTEYMSEMPSYESRTETFDLGVGNYSSGHARITLLSDEESDGLASETVWEKNATKHNLTVKHQDEEGNDIATSDEKQVVVGDAYTTTPKTIENYTVKTTPANANGTMPDSDVEIIYVYELNAGGDVTVHHYLKDTTTKLSDDETIKGKITNSYSTNAIDSLKTNYTVTEPTNKNGKFTNTTQEVTYYYEPKDYSLIVHYYIKDTTTKISDDVSQNKKYNDAYTTSAITNEHYTLVATPANATGTITGNTEIIYYYEPKDYTLIVHYYIKDTTTKISDDVSQNKKYNESYTTNAVTNENYTLVVTPANATGTIAGNTEVTYYYEPKNYTLTVHYYIKDTTTKISKDVTQNKKYNDAYTTSAVTNENYTLAATPANATGTITGNTEVIYYYEPKDYSLIVHYYIKDTTTKISEDVTQNKKYNDAYTTSAVTNENYTLVATPTNANGTVTGNTEVIYYYEPKDYKVTVHHYIKNTTTKLVPDQEINKKYNEEYTSSPDSELTKHYDVVMPPNANGTVTGNTEVIYYYTPKEYKLTVHHYVLETTTSLSPDVNETKKYNESYTTKAESYENYNYVSVEGIPNGKISDNTVVIYYYKLKDSGTITEVHKDCTDGECVVIPEASDKEICSDKKYGETCSSTCPVVYGYILNGEKSLNTIVTDKTQTLECKYEKEVGEPVIKNPIDEDGNPITIGGVISTEAMCKNQYINSTCKVSCDEIDGYILKTIPADEDIIITDKEQEKQCVYEKRKPGIVNIIYQDENGVPIETDKIEGYVDDPYTTEEKKIPGYELVEIPSNKEGIISLDEITVMYAYRKIENPFTGDFNIVPFMVVGLGSISVIGSAVYFFKKRKEISK